jgi:outer membrane protein assembly factor BamE (lipoprotein component of BamABCDE complex)
MKNLLCILAAALLCGCASVGHKLDQSKVDQIKKGETTRDQVIQLIGSPDQITRAGDGSLTFQYIYTRATTKPSTFIPIVGAFAGGMNMQNQITMVTFNSSNIVSDVFTTYGANEMNTGVTTGSKPSLPDTESNKRP